MMNYQIRLLVFSIEQETSQKVITLKNIDAPYDIHLDDINGYGDTELTDITNCTLDAVEDGLYSVTFSVTESHIGGVEEPEETDFEFELVNYQLLWKLHEEW